MSAYVEEAFVEEAIAFLSQYFDVSSPRIILNCEESCPRAEICTYLACYQPGPNRVSFRTGYEQGFIVAHEMGHRLEEAGRLQDGEALALQMETWWNENVNELMCLACGYPLFLTDETPPGISVTCPNCGSVHETIPR